MKYIDLTRYNKTFEQPKKLLQHRGVLDSDLLDFPCQIANKFNLNYCDCGMSLCLYEQFTEIPSFYAFLLVKKRSVLNNEEVQKHESVYNSENSELRKILANHEGREIMELISYEETRTKALDQFARFIYSVMACDNSVYYWIKLEENTCNIPLIKAKLENYHIHATNMPNEANILILTAAQGNEQQEL